MLGPLKAGQLDKLLTSRPKSPGIVSLLSKQGPTCGFNEMFSFAFAKFHVRFLGDNASYLASKQYAQKKRSPPIATPRVSLHLYTV